MIKFHQAYDSTVWHKAEEKLKKKRRQRLEKNAAALGYKLICAPMT